MREEYNNVTKESRQKLATKNYRRYVQYRGQMHAIAIEF